MTSGTFSVAYFSTLVKKPGGTGEISFLGEGSISDGYLIVFKLPDQPFVIIFGDFRLPQ